jgi:hypothetical protein
MRNTPGAWNATRIGWIGHFWTTTRIAGSIVALPLRKSVVVHTATERQRESALDRLNGWCGSAMVVPFNFNAGRKSASNAKETSSKDWRRANICQDE